MPGGSTWYGSTCHPAQPRKQQSSSSETVIHPTDSSTHSPPPAQHSTAQQSTPSKQIPRMMPASQPASQPARRIQASCKLAAPTTEPARQRPEARDWRRDDRQGEESGRLVWPQRHAHTNTSPHLTSSDGTAQQARETGRQKTHSHPPVNDLQDFPQDTQTVVQNTGLKFK